MLKEKASANIIPRSTFHGTLILQPTGGPGKKMVSLVEPMKFAKTCGKVWVY